MAVMVNLCWMLALGASWVLSVRAECTKECALCLFGSLQQAESRAAPCTLQCGGNMDLRNLEICKDALSEDQRNEVAGPKPEPDDLEHLLSKKYGGFMKRYGGFMMKKALDDLQDTPNKYDRSSKAGISEGRNKEELDILREILREDADANEEAKDLQKRYGGFMRRVGRPQWLDEPKPYGLRKRWDEEHDESSLPEAHKRYGGFMD